MGKRAPVRMTWSKRERDYMFHFDKHKADGRMLNSFFGGGAQSLLPNTGSGLTQAFREMLRARGLDPDTFQISVRRLDAPKAQEAGEP